MNKSKLYIPTIGIEIHVQLNTNQKIFCFCLNESNVQQPNKNVCPICFGYPGVLPLINKDVVNAAIKVGLATNCTITMESQFARKHYFYADLPKGYQITQSDLPICQEGFVEIRNQDYFKKIRIKRIHMEEDAGKNIHSATYGSLVDYNRAGTPLLEIVSYPDIESAEEAYLYLKAMHGIVTALGITSGNMEDGAFRADTNISVREAGQEQLGVKCELKNINSFKFIKDATIYEIQRQIELIESGGVVLQQTRLWHTKDKKTYGMREKEGAADYRYLPDPDIPFINITQKEIDQIKNTIPELPAQKIDRFVSQYRVTYQEAQILVGDIFLSDYFEKVYVLFSSKLVINWVLRDLIGLLKDKNITFRELLFSPIRFAKLLELIEQKKITPQIAKEILNALYLDDKCPLEYATQNHLLIKHANISEVEAVIKDVLAKNQIAVDELKSGKVKARTFLIGKIMGVLKGKVDPATINLVFDKLIK